MIHNDFYDSEWFIIIENDSQLVWMIQMTHMIQMAQMIQNESEFRWFSMIHNDLKWFITQMCSMIHWSFFPFGSTIILLSDNQE